MPVQSRNDQGGFIGILVIIVVAILSVVVYSFIKAKAKEQGLELPF